MNSSGAMLKLLARRSGPGPGSVSFKFPTSKCFSSQPTSTTGSTAGSATGSNFEQFSSTESAQSLEKTGDQSSPDDTQRATISKAMTAYLKRAKDHQEFMQKQEQEFVFGRRHLANMMGKDPENFKQKDINEAIRYLFPSGLYEPLARPMMKPPQEIYPKQKAAQFDMSGRPHHPFFYTANPNFYYLLHEMVGKLNALEKLAPSKSEVELVDESSLAGSQWLTKVQLEGRLLEKLSDQNYSQWISCFDRLAAHPKRDKELEFIKSYRKELAQQAKADDFPPITLEPDGRKSVHVPVCMKKSARADVLVTVPGTGEFKVNGKGLEYFKLMQSREAVITPLQLVGWLGKCDVEANCEGGTLACDHLPEPGETSRAMAVRWGISTALAALGAEVEKLRLAGLLVKDHRNRERKKCGRVGARAKWTWKKR